MNFTPKKLLTIAGSSLLFVFVVGSLFPAIAQTSPAELPFASEAAPGINLENLLSYTPFQHDMVANLLTLGYAAQAAGLVYFLATLREVAPRFRLASVLSAVVMVSAFLELYRLEVDWRSAFVFSTDSGLWEFAGDTFSNGFRYMNWSIDVPMLLLQLAIVLGLSRSQTFSYGTQFVVGGLLMIWTGYIGQFYEVTAAGPFWIWGIVSTVFYLYILAVVWKVISKGVGDFHEAETGSKKIMKSIRWYILITWTLYPIAYVIPAIAPVAWGAVVRQLIFTIADITTKVVYGVILSIVARQRSRVLKYEANYQEEPTAIPTNN